MADFSYVRAHSLDQAVRLLNEPGLRSRVLAGGTDLVVQIRSGDAFRRHPFDRLVDVTRVPELRVIEADGQVTVGAAVTHSEIAASPILQRHAPFLVQACRQIGSPQIRNVGTIGGNVANAAACADTLPVLVCLGADAVVVTPSGEQRLAVEDLVTGVRQTSLPQGALIRAFVFDPPPAGSRTTFLRVGRRRAMAIARLSLAAMGALDGSGRIATVRLVPGATHPRYRRATAVEDALIGQEPTGELFAAAGRRMAGLFLDASGSRWSAPYKEPALAALTERALGQVLAVTREA